VIITEPVGPVKKSRVPNISTIAAVRLVIALIVLLAVVRILTEDRSRPQGFDEPAHVAAGMEWLQLHTYSLDPLHPPISRLAMAAPLFLSGARLKEVFAQNPDFWGVGNSVLNQGSYLRNLSLAREGILPFLAILICAVFLWTRRRFDELTALGAVALLLTLPIMLAFSSLAYTDMPAACIQIATFFLFAEWLDDPAWKNSTALAMLFGLAILTKFTSLLYIPAGAGMIVVYRTLVQDSRHESTSQKHGRKLALIALLSLLIIWAGYRFSVGRVDAVFHLTPANMPTLQHFPAPLRSIARSMIQSDWMIPAPSFVKGLSEAWVLNKSAPPAYLFEKHRNGGWWYFFLAEILFKTPLAFLILATIGSVSLYRQRKHLNWKSLVPVVVIMTILGLTTGVNTNYGLRHVLIIFPLLAIVAGCGANYLWSGPHRWRLPARTLAGCLLAWQCTAALRPRADSIAYFNELAGKDPSRIAVTGCDLDCGQDLLALADELHRQQADHVSLAVWSSADLSRLGLPPFEVLKPFQASSGWIAVSVRAVREGSVMHESYPPGAFAWLDRYSPLKRVGTTIRLYHLPPVPTYQAGTGRIPPHI